MKSDQKSFPNRSSKDYLNMGRTQMENHLRTERKKERKGKPLHELKEFLSRTIWYWAYYYLQSRFGKKHVYPQYQPPNTGIYPVGKGDASTRPVVVAIAGDWATDTREAFEIADRMNSYSPDYTIHIGDTYFVGAPLEIRNNFIRRNAPWVKGAHGSFALLGNHEMYARGVAFFRDLLPHLGLNQGAHKYSGQQCGHFCLENDYWRIVGLDTGYHSVGIPILEFLPWFKPDCRLPVSLVAWLRDVVKLGDPHDRRGILFLTHHQYISAFKEGEFTAPAIQLATIIGSERPVLWLWGHEHKLAIYDKARVGQGVTAYGRCIGHGGTPIELDGKAFKTKPANAGFPYLLHVDRRFQKMVGKEKTGYNGFALVKLHNDSLTLEYHDNRKLLLSEDWKSGPDHSLTRTVTFLEKELQER